MNFDYSPVQVELRNSLTKYFEKNYSFENRQQYSSQSIGFSERVWQHFAQIGLLGLTVPVSYGGFCEVNESSLLSLEASNAVDAMWIMEIFGSVLCLEPYISSVVMGVGALLQAGSMKQKQDLIPKISAGQLRIACAILEPTSRYSYEHVAMNAKLECRDGSSNKSWLLTGLKSVVLCANSAHFFMVSARTSGEKSDTHGISLFCIPADTPGISLSSYPTHDGSRASDIAFDGVQVTEDNLVGKIDEGFDVIENMIARASAALCAEAVGVMSRLCDLTLRYLKTRQQFGVTIGNFQALQHRMADMIVATEQARSMAFLAAQSFANSDRKKKLRDVSAAKAYISSAGRLVAQEAIQMHGGIGVTNELSVGHYFKRMTLITHSFGDFNHHIGVVSDYLLLQSVNN